MLSRLDQLEQFYNEDPNDPFNIYGLALECLKSDITRSKSLFDLLIHNHEEYVPTYYHAAKLYAELDLKDKAIEIYKKGIAQAKKANNAKAVRELQSAHDELVFE